MLTPPSCEGMRKTHEQGSTTYYSTADQRHWFFHQATTQVRRYGPTWSLGSEKEKNAPRAYTLQDPIT